MELNSLGNPHRSPAIPSPAAPTWWSAGADNFSQLLQLRSDICEHDAAMAKTARNTLMGTLLGAVTIYSADAAGAVPLPLESTTLAALALLACLLAAAWVVDRRLVGQIRDTNLRASLWQGLVEAARKGGIDASRLNAGDSADLPAAALLRSEAATALRCVAAHGALAPYVPTFSSRFALKDSRPARSI